MERITDTIIKKREFPFWMKARLDKEMSSIAKEFGIEKFHYDISNPRHNVFYVFIEFAGDYRFTETIKFVNYHGSVIPNLETDQFAINYMGSTFEEVEQKLAIAVNRIDRFREFEWYTGYDLSTTIRDLNPQLKDYLEDRMFLYGRFDNMENQELGYSDKFLTGFLSSLFGLSCHDKGYGHLAFYFADRILHLYIKDLVFILKGEETNVRF